MSETAAPARRPFSVPLFLRTLLGLVLAPAVGGSVAFVMMVALDGTGKFVGWTGDIPSYAFLGAYLGAIYGILPALIIGWPIHLLLLRQRWTHPAIYIAIGPLLALLAFVLIGVGIGGPMGIGRLFG